VGSELGISEEKILALDEYTYSPLYDEEERVALEYADAITLSDWDVSDELRIEQTRRIQSAPHTPHPSEDSRAPGVEQVIQERRAPSTGMGLENLPDRRLHPTRIYAVDACHRLCLLART
jgi:hypothetical protein